MKVVQQAGKAIEGVSDDAEEEVGSNECELPLDIWVLVLKFFVLSGVTRMARVSKDTAYGSSSQLYTDPTFVAKGVNKLQHNFLPLPQGGDFFFHCFQILESAALGRAPGGPQLFHAGREHIECSLASSGTLLPPTAFLGSEIILSSIITLRLSPC